MARISEGTKCYVWSGQHGTYLPATVAAVRGGVAVVTSQNGVQRIAVASLALSKPQGYR